MGMVCMHFSHSHGGERPWGRASGGYKCCNGGGRELGRVTVEVLRRDGAVLGGIIGCGRWLEKTEREQRSETGALGCDWEQEADMHSELGC